MFSSNVNFFILKEEQKVGIKAIAKGEETQEKISVKVGNQFYEAIVLGAGENLKKKKKKNSPYFI